MSHFDDSDLHTEERRKVVSVSQLNTQIRDSLQRSFPSVWVGGEVSDLARPQSGHIYLSLKDEQGQLRAVIWRTTASRIGFDLHDGMDVICEGHVDVYPPRGTYQLIIRQIEPVGIGALQLALRQLRDRLAAEGLFDSHHKKPLPRFPRRIAVVTSPTGAAVRDLLAVVKRRWPGVRITVVPTRVQGEEATPEIVSAIETAHQLKPSPDVLVVTRGGGSLEDLWCFNEEPVVRAIFEASIPVVSAVGHEIDVTLADLVADVRALTPTEAGERIVPMCDEIRAELDHLVRRMDGSLRTQLEMLRARLDGLAERPVLKNPMQQVQDRTHLVDDLSQRIQRSLDQQLTRSRERTEHLTQQLEALSPLAVLGRGYSLTERIADGSLIRDASEVQPGDEIRTRLANGELISTILEAKTEPTDESGRT
jgi:exodeoxyribonuclease VII large subunit